jgi:hypothetical protein
MENTSVSKYTISFGLSVALTSVINALLVVAKEKIPTLTAGLQQLTGHQWVSHSAIMLVLFTVLGWVFAKANGGRGIQITVKGLISTLVSGVVIGGLVIVGFYLVGD